MHQSRRLPVKKTYARRQCRVTADNPPRTARDGYVASCANQEPLLIHQAKQCGTKHETVAFCSERTTLKRQRYWRDSAHKPGMSRHRYNVPKILALAKTRDTKAIKCTVTRQFMNWIYDNHFMKLSRKLNLESKYELKLLPVSVSAQQRPRLCRGRRWRDKSSAKHQQHD